MEHMTAFGLSFSIKDPVKDIIQAIKQVMILIINPTVKQNSEMYVGKRLLDTG